MGPFWGEWKISKIELDWAELSWDKLSCTELNWAELIWDKLGCTEMNWAELSWGGLSWQKQRKTKWKWSILGFGVPCAFFKFWKHLQKSGRQIEGYEGFLEFTDGDGSMAGVRRNGHMGDYMDGRTDGWMIGKEDGKRCRRAHGCWIGCLITSYAWWRKPDGR